MSILPATPSMGVPTTYAPPAGRAMQPAAGAVALDPLRLLRKHSLSLVVAALVGVVLGVGAYFPLLAFFPSYSAEAIFEVVPPKNNPLDANAVQADEEQLDRGRQAAVSQIASLTMATQLVDSARLQQVAAGFYNDFRRGGTFERIKAADALDDYHLKASVIPNTNRFKLRAEYRTRKDAFGLAFLAMDLFDAELRRGHGADMSSDIDRINQQINNLEDERQQKESQKQVIMGEAGLASSGNVPEPTIREMDRVGLQLSEIKALTVQSQTTLDEFEQRRNDPAGPQIPDDIKAAIANNQQLSILERDLTNQRAFLLSLTKQGFTPEHPQVVRAQALIDSLATELEARKQALQNEYFLGQIQSFRIAISGYNQQIDNLQAEFDALAARAEQQAQASARVEVINGRLEAIERELSTLRQSKQKLEISRDAYEFRVIQRPTEPERHDFPNLLVTTAAGVVICLGAVAGLLLLAEVTDQRIKGPSDIRSLLGAGAMAGFLPDTEVDPQAPERVETAFRDRPAGVFAESVRQVRAPILRRMDVAGHRTLLVVSPTPGSGGTTVATNLAFSMAAAQRRTLLIDANFRRPAIHKALGISEGPGLGEALLDSTPLEQLVRPSGTPGLDVLTAGSPGRRTIEALTGDAMRDLLERLRQTYAAVIIDTAPAIVASDSRVLANLTDASILVARAMQEKRGLLVRVFGELEQGEAECIGVVMNGVRHTAGGYIRKNMQTSFKYLAAAEPTGKTNA